jgi:hypothetical protein
MLTLEPCSDALSCAQGHELTFLTRSNGVLVTLLGLIGTTTADYPLQKRDATINLVEEN